MANQNQKRDNQGRFKSTGKAKRVSPEAVVRPPAASAALKKTSGTMPNKVAKRSIAPRGHLGDGVNSVHEYVEMARRVYVAFLHRIGR